MLRRDGECFEYQFGFCLNGPNCFYRHTSRPRSDLLDIPHIPKSYFEKVRHIFNHEKMGNF